MRGAARFGQLGDRMSQLTALVIRAAMPEMPRKPSIVTARKPRHKAPKPAKAEATPTPPRIVKARKPGARHVPDLSPEELQQRRAAADELWRELVRRATGKEFKRDF